MSLFLSRELSMGTKTYYNASTQRLLSNKDFKSASELALQMHIYKQRKTFKPDLKAQGLPEELVSTHLAASHRKFKKLRKLAAKGNYWFGLPTSSFSSETEEDIDKFAEELKRKLKAQLEDDTIIILS